MSKTPEADTVNLFSSAMMHRNHLDYLRDKSPQWTTGMVRGQTINEQPPWPNRRDHGVIICSWFSGGVHLVKQQLGNRITGIPIHILLVSTAYVGAWSNWQCDGVSMNSAWSMFAIHPKGNSQMAIVLWRQLNDRGTYARSCGFSLRLLPCSKSAGDLSFVIPAG